jgi:predicted membrane channel-forming protein YqfA (hemolysin III family)
VIDDSRSSRLSQSHPNLYKAFTAYALISLALGLNFIFLKPTFDPLGVPKGLIGAIFLALGSTKLLLLNVYRSLRLLRLVMAMAIGVMLFWTGALTLAFFKLGQTSLQLPITYLGLSILGMPLLVEPSVNPITDKNGVNGNSLGTEKP